MIRTIELFLPADFALPAALRGYDPDDEAAIQVALYHEFDLTEPTDAAVRIGNYRGRWVHDASMLVYSDQHQPGRIRADQDRAAGRIAALLGVAIRVHAACRPISAVPATGGL